MKKIILPISILVSTFSLISCSGKDEPNEKEELSKKELALKSAAESYVDNTVIPTYSAMSDAAMELHELTLEMKSKHTAGLLTSADIAKAGEAWKRSRKSWELSEAFLFGPAANHNIDPHIDSWPLDKAAMDDLLKEIRTGKKNWSLDNNGGYGLIGFHSVEYMLFQLSEDENISLIHSTEYTDEELVYLTAVTEDLRNQAICLEACWAGKDNISAAKKIILDEAGLDYGEEFGWEMKNATRPGSRYKTFQAVAEEIIQGCIDIADEVGNTKIGRPHLASSEEDKNYIESPYSLNSIEDFADNIISIRNSYCGMNSECASVSDYVKSINPELDTKLRKAIENAVSAINDIPEPFTKSATGAIAGKAVKVVGEDLVEALEEVYDAILKN